MTEFGIRIGKVKEKLSIKVLNLLIKTSEEEKCIYCCKWIRFGYWEGLKYLLSTNAAWPADFFQQFGFLYVQFMLKNKVSANITTDSYHLLVTTLNS